MKILYVIFIAVVFFSGFAHASDHTSTFFTQQERKNIDNQSDSNKWVEKVKEVYEKSSKKLNKSQWRGKAKDFYKAELSYQSRKEDYEKVFKNNQDLLGYDYKALKNNKSCYSGENLGSFNHYLFISSSVPEATLKNYNADVNKRFDDTLIVLKGVVGNNVSKMKPTMNFILNIACDKTMDELVAEEKQCNNVRRYDINPALFKMFDIQRVPALVYTPLSYSEIMAIQSSGERIKEKDFVKIYGDMSLQYMRKQIYNFITQSGGNNEQN